MADVSHNQHELFEQQSKSKITKRACHINNFKWKQLIGWNKSSRGKLRQSTILRVAKGEKILQLPCRCKT